MAVNWDRYRERIKGARTLSDLVHWRAPTSLPSNGKPLGNTAFDRTARLLLKSNRAFPYQELCYEVGVSHDTMRYVIQRIREEYPLQEAMEGNRKVFWINS